MEVNREWLKLELKYGQKESLMEKTPISVKITSAFLILNAAIWLGFGIAVFARLHPALPDNPMWVAIMGVLALAAAVVFVLMNIFLLKRWKPAFSFSLFFLFVVVLLTFADDFGTLDLIYAAVVLVPAILIIVDRKWYLSREKKARKKENQGNPRR